MDEVDVTGLVHMETDTWHIMAIFRHLDKPVIYDSGKSPFGKTEAYMWAARWLMSENIQIIKVFKNKKLRQTITIEETPDA